MKVEVAFTADEVQYRDKGNKIGVVIDVLRTTTSAVMALKNGCSSFIPITSIEEAREMSKRFETGKVLLSGAKSKGSRFRALILGILPMIIRKRSLREKTLYLPQAMAQRRCTNCRAPGRFLSLLFLIYPQSLMGYLPSIMMSS